MRHLRFSLVFAAVAWLPVWATPVGAKPGPLPVNLGITAAEPAAVIDDGRVVLRVFEVEAGRDLNGDGDSSDSVVHLWDPATGLVSNLGLASWSGTPLRGGRLAVAVDEQRQGALDLNGDGDAADSVLHIYDAAKAATRNVGLQNWGMTALDEGRLAFLVHEMHQGDADLNGDGDRRDPVLHVWDPSTGAVANLGLAAWWLTPLGGGRVAFAVDEVLQGHRDLNDDGDDGDDVLHVWNPESGTVTNLGLASARRVALEHGRLAFLVKESRQGNADLNGDGDANDTVPHAWDPALGVRNSGLATTYYTSLLATAGGGVTFRVPEDHQGNSDLNGDGDATDAVLHVWDPGTGAITNPRLAMAGYSTPVTVLDGGAVAFMVSEAWQRGTDLNGDGDTRDEVVHVWDWRTGAVTNTGLPGVELYALEGGLLAVFVPEARLGRPYGNGDRDADDLVLHVWDPGAGRAANLRLAARGLVPLAGGGMAFLVSEMRQGRADLNGDGDASDDVVHVWREGPTLNLGLPAWHLFRLGEGFSFGALEPDQGADLNGDGDQDDSVLHLWR